jgi:hypothetical protein
MQPVAVTRSLASCIEGCALRNAFCIAAECYRLAACAPRKQQRTGVVSKFPEENLRVLAFFSLCASFLRDIGSAVE